MPEADILRTWDDFPKIGLIVEGKKKFFRLSEAVRLWDSGFVRVEDTGEVLESDFSVRRMTPEENLVFQRRVDDYSESK